MVTVFEKMAVAGASVFHIHIFYAPVSKDRGAYFFTVVRPYLV